MAHMRYLIWGDMADNEGMPNIGRLFRHSLCRWVHADNHFKVLKDKVGDASVAAGAILEPVKQLITFKGGAINGELHEVEQMYPVYLNTARFKVKKVLKNHFTMHWAEKIHAKLLKKRNEQQSRVET